VRLGTKWAALGLLAWGASLTPARFASAQEVNCANEFRSGKLYFSQKIYQKAVDHLAVAVKTCPDKAEYRARYAIALAQLGDEKLRTVEATGDVAGNQAVVDTALDLYRKAGSEFDASLKAPDSSKQNVKFVDENRKHFWVTRYNEGIKLSQEEKAEAATLEFQLSRLIDPRDVKAYKQGSIELINQEKMVEAEGLIKEGLGVAPGDSMLTSLMNRVRVDVAQAEVKKADAAQGAEALMHAAKAESLYDIALAADGKNANLLFDSGLAGLTLGSAQAGADSVIPPNAVATFRKAAAAFHQAKGLVPATQDSSFYTSALYNEIQASINADDVAQAVDLLKEYLNFDCKDDGIWKTYAQALYRKGDQTTGGIAFIISNSISKGSTVPISDAKKNAIEDAATALTSMGDPDHVFAYTDVLQNKTVSIETWLWCGKHKATVFYLGKNNGDVPW
jgi:tetratricopeptide (TPR) repeat protein